MLFSIINILGPSGRVNLALVTPSLTEVLINVRSSVPPCDVSGHTPFPLEHCNKGVYVTFYAYLF